MNNKQFNTIDNVDIDYHPISAQIYPANYLDKLSDFEKTKMNEFNRLNEDNCYNQRKDVDNVKKLKYMTWNGIELLQGKESLNFFGIGIKDELFVPSEKIDTYSSLLNGDNGGVLTNEKIKNSFGQLPLPTLPYKGQLQHGDVIKEDKIRNYIDVKKNACLPKDSNFEIRSFYIFDDSQGIETPKAIDSVEIPESGFSFGRTGIPSRFCNRFEKNNKPTYITNEYVAANTIYY
jgi:hypothetical protein